MLTQGKPFSPCKVFGDKFSLVLSKISIESLTLSQKNLLLVLKEYQDDKRVFRTPPQNEIASEIGVSLRTLERVVSMLKKGKYLETNVPSIAEMRNKGEEIKYLFLWKKEYADAALRAAVVIKKHFTRKGTKVDKQVDKVDKNGYSLDKMLTRIKAEYHPARAFSQGALAKNELKKIIEESIDKNRKLSSSGRVDKRVKEEIAALEEKKILTYIDSLKSTKAWGNDGKFLLGLGNLIRERPWEYSSKQKGVREKNEGRAGQLDNFKDFIMGV